MKYVPEEGKRKERELNGEALDYVAEALVALFDAIPSDDYTAQREAMKQAAKALLPAFDALKEIEKYHEVRAERGKYRKE